MLHLPYSCTRNDERDKEFSIFCFEPDQPEEITCRLSRLYFAGICFAPSQISQAVGQVGAEDAEELILDATVMAGQMTHRNELKGKQVTPGNIAYELPQKECYRWRGEHG